MDFHILGPLEAFRVAQIEASTNFNYTPLVAAAVLYLCVTVPLARWTAASRVERTCWSLSRIASADTQKLFTTATPSARFTFSDMPRLPARSSTILRASV